jgi:hypothetical protein
MDRTARQRSAVITYGIGRLTMAAKQYIDRDFLMFAHLRYAAFTDYTLLFAGFLGTFVHGNT